jgi:hypothetical protein
MRRLKANLLDRIKRRTILRLVQAIRHSPTLSHGNGMLPFPANAN